MKELSLNEVSQFVGEYFRAGVEDVERLTGGEWSQAFGLRCVGRNLVARFGDYEDDFLKDNAAAALTAEAMPVPQIHGMGKEFGGYFCISERAYGEILESLDAAKMKAIVPAVLRLLDALREANVEEWTRRVGAPQCSWREQLLSVDEENDRVFGWHDRMTASPTGDEPYRRGLAYLRANIGSCPEIRHLTHNDLLHNNVLARNDRIAAVFDWGCASLGDFLYELAMFTFYAPWFPAMEGIDWAAEALLHYQGMELRVPEMQARLRCYEIHLGLSGMAYSAFKENWAELDANARHIMARLEAA